MAQAQIHCCGNTIIRKFICVDNDEYSVIESCTGALWLEHRLHEKGLFTSQSLDNNLYYSEIFDTFKNSEGQYRVKNRIGHITDYSSNSFYRGTRNEGSSEANMEIVWDEGLVDKPYNIPYKADYHFWIPKSQLPGIEQIKNIKNLIFIIDVDILRNMGAYITKSISWERTALNIVWQYSHNKTLSILKMAKMVIITCGFEGAIVFDNINACRTLWYNPLKMEGDTKTTNSGDVPDAWGFMIPLFVKEFNEGLKTNTHW
jgi:hypothetical protein